ncbi:hypothetical protein Amico_1096 [Aminobacterium colombiense DSM 12261]|uniref:Uncharacterized protein n=1 Tax=Aminobacterium colombiense (strain DSM 12261 / ALA-1) TaxID=572547 RepID=D5EF88_AMICL|nr:hypothetical protein Amico_1096 [Aminobacterium colombiense DSM 12261]
MTSFLAFVGGMACGAIVTVFILFLLAFKDGMPGYP